jgi:hypothetical protein
MVWDDLCATVSWDGQATTNTASKGFMELCHISLFLSCFVRATRVIWPSLTSAYTNSPGMSGSVRPYRPLLGGITYSGAVSIIIPLYQILASQCKAGLKK